MGESEKGERREGGSGGEPGVSLSAACWSGCCQMGSVFSPSSPPPPCCLNTRGTETKVCTVVVVGERRDNAALETLSRRVWVSGEGDGSERVRGRSDSLGTDKLKGRKRRRE